MPAAPPKARQLFGYTSPGQDAVCEYLDSVETLNSYTQRKSPGCFGIAGLFLVHYKGQTRFIVIPTFSPTFCDFLSTIYRSFDSWPVHYLIPKVVQAVVKRA